ncbi:hypothetical protein M0811_04421 [Anaeramoeba ignava]|uniref:F-box domain-containing protein n=1 Tax=Anaeramoeba ignava TaxID=1746090 RepID=A0A9Q0LY26_ANAIG|nr:hypothetical protein M0811_04421 [Anaeramoeba ignava]
MGNQSHFRKNENISDRMIENLENKEKSTRKYIMENIREGDLDSVFGLLPDEIVLYIFQYLRKDYLHICSKTCTRFFFLAYDFQLWKKIEVSLASQAITDSKVKSAIRHSLRTEELKINQGFSLTSKALSYLTQNARYLKRLSLSRTRKLKTQEFEKITKTFQNSLEELMLYDCSFLADNLDFLADFTKIQKIVLHSPEIETIPEKISGNPNLNFLEISRSLLSMPQFYLEKPPLSISSLNNFTSLNVLKINFANWSIFPNEICFLKNLQALDLSDNRFVQIPKEIENLKQLLFLNLSNNQIIELPTSLGSLSLLDYLDIRSNNLEFLPKSLLNLSNLSCFLISGNNFIEAPSAIYTGEIKFIWDWLKRK